jgi:sugar phosphate isomerase/epimerase
MATRSSPKLGVDLAGLRLPFQQALNLAAELGADAVEIDAREEFTPQELSRTGLREVRKMLADRRLRVAAVAFRTRRGYAVPEDLDRRVGATKAAMELASQLGAPVVVNSIGRIPPDDDALGRQMLRDVLDDLARFGSRVGAILTAETGSESGEELGRVLAELPGECLGVALNPGKLLAAGFSPQDAVAALGPRIRHVHATDARRGNPVSLGQGDVDYPTLLAALDEHGYRDCFVVSCTGAGDPKRELADAIAQFRKYAGG